MGLKIPEGLQLSDEQKAELERQFSAEQTDTDELKRLRRESKEKAVDEKIEGFGLSDNPGIAKFLKRVYMADDAGETAAVLLADPENPQEKSISLSEAFDEFLGLVKKQGDLKIALSAQGTQHDDHGRAPDDASDEVATTHEQDMAEASKILGLQYDKPVTRS